MKTYLGIDVGSISTNLVVINENSEVLYSLYIRTEGNPISAIQRGFKDMREKLSQEERESVSGVGTTGSARYLVGVITGADIVKNEITAHAKGATHFIPEVRTVVEIGGQDSKIIIMEDGVVVDFAMNTLCAAGCGAFLDAQAHRLGIPIEEFGEIAARSQNPTNISGRCTIFSESDMIHKQQIGHSKENIVSGLCHALVRNYLNSVAKGKNIQAPIVFQGGVSENAGMKEAFEKVFSQEVMIPKHNKVMGALGAAILVKEKITGQTKFKGWNISDLEIKCTSFQCKGCSNQCEVIEARINDEVIARWGDRCGKWSNLNPQ